ncbi:MAG: PD40 domain-containing protein, partial [Gemmatimonadetes bacterium]|nr:PD40 domain-containing protein [Gemmatimonadota bacterium]
MTARRIAVRFATLVVAILVATAICTTTVALTPTTAAAQVDARMLRQPDVSQTHIAFVYAGDIWVVEKEGGTAKRLSSPRGGEQFPRFSPDGSRIAFSGFYDGNSDVYVIPTLGGEPSRVTYHPGGDRMLDWTPDGSILFASGRETGV